MAGVNFSTCRSPHAAGRLAVFNVTKQALTGSCNSTWLLYTDIVGSIRFSDTESLNLATSADYPNGAWLAWGRHLVPWLHVFGPLPCAQSIYVDTGRCANNYAAAPGGWPRKQGRLGRVPPADSMQAVWVCVCGGGGGGVPPTARRPPLMLQKRPCALPRPVHARPAFSLQNVHSHPRMQASPPST